MVPIRRLRPEVDHVALDDHIIDLLIAQRMEEGRQLDIFLVVECAVEEVACRHERDGREDFVPVLFNLFYNPPDHFTNIDVINNFNIRQCLQGR